MSAYDQLLNPMQREAVYATEGPLLVLAGAGSGKTRVLTHRIAYLIEEKGVNPWNILAITFTNKAAQEMRQRVDRLVERGAESIWVSTFHSACVRILRRHIEFLGYSTHFTIYDEDDRKSLLKRVCKEMNVDTRMYREKAVLSDISSAKDSLTGPDAFITRAGVDYYKRRVGEIYQEYQKAMKRNDALDFDDLIFRTVDLFRTQPEVLDYYQERFRYILVDEYQDTNRAQFELVRLLASKYGNICVVGDDDQSIYKFRGADVGNILNFEDAFPGAKVVKLEQNYRSTQNILDAANGVIRNNCGRKEKSLWTANGAGQKLVFREFDQAGEEADYIVRDILDRGCPYRDCAVLYRTNAQSRLLEETCIVYNVPYRLIGGVNFYQRKEVKDILAYLRTIANGSDDLALTRIINVPKRGIGAASLGKVTVFASENGLTLYGAMLRAEEIPGLGKAAERLARFTEQIESFRRRLADRAADQAADRAADEAADRAAGRTADEEDRAVDEAAGEAADRAAGRTADEAARKGASGYGIRQLIGDILEETGYRRELEEEGKEEAESRLENIEELVNKAAAYTEEADEPTLDGFLEEVALVADIDQLDRSEDRVTLMTLHGAKGLEFDHVYLSGMEDGLFPSYMSISSDDPGDMEEERRLCYVGITRARKSLTLTCARRRMVNGENRYNRISRFLEEIPGGLLTGVRPDARAGAVGPAGLRGGQDPRSRQREDLRGPSGGTALPGGQGRPGQVAAATGTALPGGQGRPGQVAAAAGTALPGDQGRPGQVTAADRPAGGRDARFEPAYEQPVRGLGLSPRTARRARPEGTSRFAPDSRPNFGKTFEVNKSPAALFRPGDRVNHVKFGEGTVREVKERVRDYEVTVEFDKVGVRKILASFLQSGLT